ncbi:MAG: extracellular solute-binding protein family 5 [Thermomicrobiales bacterium]|jgi:peptide/nickel transport system substrate-binding protein|nr:extracellular solute-binding protein family 5 [Thermomicrobiales bacterium]
MSLGYDPRMHQLMARAARKRLSRRTALKRAAAGGLLLSGLGSYPLLRTAGAQAAGTVTIGMPEEPITMDPQFADGVNEYNVLINIMDGLFTTGENIEVVPRLVESWEQIDDLTWEFALRSGIVFHNGEPLTANDVKATYERSLDPDLATRNTWGEDINLESVEVVDDLTVRFHTSEFTPHMLARLANDHFIMPASYLLENDPTTVARHPIGTGAYVFDEWVAGEQITMSANPEYWDEPQPSIETVVWRFVPETTSRVANLETGAVDLIDGVLPSAIEQIEANENLLAVFVEGTRRVYIGLNTKVSPTDDVRVRQALNYGTDIESICEVILGGATTRMPNWMEPAFRNPEVEGYHYDPELARQLLAEAGYPDGVTVTLDYARTGSLGIDEFPQAIAISLREVGVEVELNLLEDNILSDRIAQASTGDVEAVSQLYFKTNASYFDPGLTYTNWRLDDDDNGTGYDNPEFLDLLNQMFTSGTPEERLEWAYEAQQIFTEDAPAIFLWYEPDIYGVNRRVQGFAPTGDERIRLAGLSLAE